MTVGSSYNLWGSMMLYEIFVYISQIGWVQNMSYYRREDGEREREWERQSEEAENKEFNDIWDKYIHLQMRPHT